MNGLKRLAAVLVCFLLARTSSWAWGETRVIFTVDVESNNIPLPKQVEAPCSDSSACSLMGMAQMLQERGWAGTFFLNVYEYRRWGEPTMRDIVTKLQATGQDVALHTHPQWVYDPSRWAMFQYNLDEQTSIIRDGVRLLESWTGRPVVAHRAGAYTADQNTLKALESSGIRIDSSMFWGHPWSRLNGLGIPRNLPSSSDRLIQIPVTVYQREDRPPLIGSFVAPFTSIRKIDPNWFLNKEEALSAINAVVKADLPFLVIFLHSFSFIKDQGDKSIYTADRASLDIFHAMLDHIAQRRLPVVTIRDLAESLGSLPAMSLDRDIIPQVAVYVSLHRYLWYRLKSAGKATLIAMGAVVLALVVGGMVLFAIQRRKLKADFS